MRDWHDEENRARLPSHHYRTGRFAPAAPHTVFAPGVHSACDLGVEPPTVVSGPGPLYADEAMRSRAARGALLLAVVQTDGAVGEIQVQRGVDPDLDENAVAALRTWQFHPGTYQGERAPVVISVEMTFTITKRGR